MARPIARSWRRLVSVLPFVPIVFLALTINVYLLLLLPLCLILGRLLERQINRPPWRIHLCPRCSYDLRATTAANCPECGAKVIISASGRKDSASQADGQ